MEDEVCPVIELDFFLDALLDLAFLTADDP